MFELPPARWVFVGDFSGGIGAWALGDEVATAELKLFDGIIQHPEAKAANPLTHRRRSAPRFSSYVVEPTHLKKY